MEKRTPVMRVGWLPFKLRLRLARLALWRLKHGGAVVHSLLLLCLVFGSAGVGYAVAMGGYWQSAQAAMSEKPVPKLAAATATDYMVDHQPDRMMAAELGKLQAEVVRLRVLFKRLAELAQLEDGEFDLEMTFQPSMDDVDDSESFNETGSLLHSVPEFRLVRTGVPLSSKALPLVKQALVHISDQAERMYSVFLERRVSFDARVSGMPVAGGRISSRYGYRVNPVSGRRQLHGGLDLVSEPGSKILALADGVVTYSGKNGGYGKLVELEHPDGFKTRYAHNRQLLVPLGGRVKKGQVIATMGSSGRSTGTHVHVEVRHNGRAVDPQLYIR